MVLSTLEAIAEACAVGGLILRGGFDFADGEAAPAGPSGKPARAVLLVGHAGDAYWHHVRAWLEDKAEAPGDPLDTWSREVVADVAARFGARAVSPSDRPYLPFQQWAMRAEGLKPSPLGILMHPQYGLWHSYRGALLFDAQLGLGSAPARAHPCERCTEKPCLRGCPVAAFSDRGFDVDACRSHVRSEAGIACRDGGCVARNACPAGAPYRYGTEAQRFHMHAFAP